MEVESEEQNYIATEILTRINVFPHAAGMKFAPKRYAEANQIYPQMFTEMKDSTVIITRLGDKSALKFFRTYKSIICCMRFGGRKHKA